MAIIGNKATQPGDVILIRVNAPIVGLIGLTDFIDQTAGEGGSSNFEKFFRYSANGVSFSPWIELTIPNIQAIQIDSSNVFFIEYRYEYVGDPGAELTYNESLLTGQILEQTCGPAYKRSVFKDWFGCNDTDVLLWAINVTDKVYQQGIVPKFIERGDGTTLEQDEDYVNFWRSVALFFSYFVKLTRTVGNFTSNNLIAYEYLKNKGALICSNRELQEIVFVINNFYDEIRKRGTSSVYKKGDEQNFDGEFLRLICFDRQRDEFVFSLMEPNITGWHVDNSSPLYKGTFGQIMSNKAYENTIEVEDLDPYPLINPGGIDIIEDSGLSVMEIEAGSGIGGNDVNKRIIINNDLMYEMTFFLKMENNSRLDIGITPLNVAFNSSFVESIIDGDQTNFFIEDLSLPRDDKYYFIRVLIYPKNSGNLGQNGALDLNVGNHLRFRSEIGSIIPSIIVTQGKVFIYDLKIRPAKTPYSTSFVQTNNFINCWFGNRNGDYSFDELCEVVKRYLVPYNTVFTGIDLNSL